MRKFFLAVPALLLALALAACGAKQAVQDAVRDSLGAGSEPPAATSAGAPQLAPQESAATPAARAEDGATVEGRLAKAGLTLEAVQPETFAEASLYNCNADEVVLYLSNESGQLGAAVMQPLVEKILAATAAAADDGQNWETYYGLGEPTALDMSDVNYDAFFFIGQWSYNTGGRWVTVTIGVLPAEEPEGQSNYAWEVTMAFLY